MNKKNAIEIFSQTYKQTFDEAYGYILAMTGDAKAAPTLLRNSYTELYRLLRKTKKPIDNLRTALFKIVRQKLVEYNETTDIAEPSRPDRIKKYNDFIENELNAELPPPKNKDELLALLDSALELVSQKPPLLRRTFLLYYLYDFSIKQIAQELKLTEMTVGNYIYEITKEIRIKLQQDEEVL